MPICKRSAPERVVALLGVGFSLLPAVSQAQVPGAAGHARAAVGAEGSDAMERLKAAMARQKQRANEPNIKLPAIPVDRPRRAFDGLTEQTQYPEMNARATAAITRGRETFAAEREAMAHRIGQALGLEAPEMRNLAGVIPPAASGNWVPVLFASSSMPVSTLRTYAGQLERVGGVIAFRGFVGGMTKIGPMAKLSAEILRLDPGCNGPACAMRNVQLIVDPLLFRQHHVVLVPALAMVPGDPTLPYCERDDASPVASHIVYGDAALSGLFDEYARLGGKAEVADVQARLERR